jgi:two-component system chemotaxis sensor kinase CheA
VPLSITSSHGLMLQTGQQQYALPLDGIERIVAVAPRDIQQLEGRNALVFEDIPLPVAQLGELLGGAAVPLSRAPLALILRDGRRRAACLTEAVLGEQELIAQRLPAPLARVRFISGATILANGSVVPILDTADMIDAILGARRDSLLASPEPQASRQRTILVVDDSITTRTLERNILESAGYRVRLATDGVEALQMLDQLAEDGGCDLLLSDIDMPRLNGFELAARVRSHTDYQRLPIVLVTSLDTPADRERGIAAGADAYIVKRAFDQQVLLETIAQYV